MRETWFLAAANLRKNRGQSVIFFLLILLAAAFLNLGLVTRFHYTKAFDRQAERANEADSILILQENATLYGRLEQKLSEDGRVADTETRQVLAAYGSCLYGTGRTARLFAVMNAESEHRIGRPVFLEKLESEPSDAVYLPYIFQAGGGYALGEPFSLTVTAAGQGERVFTYTIAGFFEEPLLATVNSSTTGLLMGETAYRELEESFGGRLKGRMYLTQLKEPAGEEAFTADYGSLLAAETENTGLLYDTVHYGMVKQARTVTSDIGALIGIAFSLIMAGIALIIIRFRIGNSIEEDMRNIGALKALGCTGRQICVSFLLQYLSITAAGIAAGTGFSYLLLPLLAGLFAEQTGIVWRQGFDPSAAAILSAVLLAAVTAVVLLTAGRAGKLQPIQALRNGISTHSFRSNPLPLDRSFGGLQLQLGGKAFCLQAKHNLLLAAVIAAISFAAVFAGVLYYNISWDQELYYRNFIGEMPDIEASAADPEQSGELMRRIRELPQVRKAIYCDTAALQGPEKSEIYCYLTEDFADYDVQEKVYAGRFPRYANETAIGGLMARELDKKPGDRIRLGQGESEKEFLITGLIQGTNYLGHDALMTQEAYRSLAPDYRPSAIAVYLEERSDTASVLAQIKGWQGDSKAGAEDYRKKIEASLGTYQGIVGILVIVILAVTLLVVALTLYLVIRTALLRERQELGVLKALGFTAGQLVRQKAYSYLPVVFFGTAAGCAAGAFSINPLLSLLFSGIGLMKTNFVVPPVLLLLLTAAVTLAGFLVSVLVSLRIRRISPYSLIIE